MLALLELGGVAVFNSIALTPPGSMQLALSQ